VLCLIQDAIGGSLAEVSVEGNSYSRLTVCGSTARSVLDRIRKHLVIKRHYAEACLAMANRPVSDRHDAKRQLKWERRRPSLPLPNFPSRKWLAGYLDGDGCFAVSRLTPLGSACPVLHCAAARYDTEGIEIIQKAFGGRMYDMCHGRVKQYVLQLNPSKAVEMLSMFAHHMIVKRDQAMFILGCARMGHYRDGERIRAILKQLKAHPQRLNETALDVGLLVRQVQDKLRPWNKKGLMACTHCGRNDRRHVGFGLCEICYRDETLRRRHATML